MTGQAFIMDLRPWRWGFVVLQARHDPKEFAQLLTGIGWAGRVADYDSSYASMHAAGGFCYVPDHPIPWLICLFTEPERNLRALFVHEAVHLGEFLLISEGVPLTPRTTEVRAQLVQHAIELFDKWQAGELVSNPRIEPETDLRQNAPPRTEPEPKLRQYSTGIGRSSMYNVHIWNIEPLFEKNVQHKGEDCMKLCTGYTYTDTPPPDFEGHKWQHIGPHAKEENLRLEIREVLKAHGVWAGYIYAPNSQFDTPGHKARGKMMYEFAKTGDHEVLKDYYKVMEPGFLKPETSVEEVVADLFKKK